MELVDDKCVGIRHLVILPQKTLLLQRKSYKYLRKNIYSKSEVIMIWLKPLPLIGFTPFRS